MMRRFLATAAFVLIASGLSAMMPAAADTNPAEFVRHLGNQALEVIRGNQTPAEKRSYFRHLLDEDFDVAEISRFVLGHYNRVASDPERQEFRRIFADYLVLVYSQRFAQYHGERLQVTGTRADHEGGTVTSQIIRPQGGPPIEVDWRLSVHDGLYKISDVVIDGVSMAATQRSEFAQAIQRNGGRLEGLLSMMREKIAGGGASVGSSTPPSSPPVAPR